MPAYSIWILEYSYSNKFHKSGVIYSAHNEGYIKLPYSYTVIKGNGHVAMVDVGYNNKDYAKEFAESLFVENWHSPKVVLAEVGRPGLDKPADQPGRVPLGHGH